MELASDVDIQTAITCFMACQTYIQNTFSPSSPLLPPLPPTITPLRPTTVLEGSDPDSDSEEQIPSSSSSSSSPQRFGLLLNRMSTFQSSVLYIGPSDCDDATPIPTLTPTPILAETFTGTEKGIERNTGNSTVSSPSSHHHPSLSPSVQTSSTTSSSTLLKLTDITSHLSRQFELAGLLPPCLTTGSKEQEQCKSKPRDKDKGEGGKGTGGKGSGKAKGSKAKGSWVPHCTIAKTSADRKHGR